MSTTPGISSSPRHEPLPANHTSKRIIAVILAAGASTRMGTPKQLHMYEGKSLLRRAVHTALEAGFPTLVVVGSSAEKIKGDLAGEPVQIVENPGWKEGVASSVRCAVQNVTDGADAIIIMTVDQPLVTGDLLKRIAGTYESSGAEVVACRYADTVGVPALYDRKIFGELLNLSGDVGAKQVIQRHAGQARFIDAPECAWDVDRPEDDPQN
jgi:molybdenum cofactor cytidylyltransferase